MSEINKKNFAFIRDSSTLAKLAWWGEGGRRGKNVAMWRRCTPQLPPQSFAEGWRPLREVCPRPLFTPAEVDYNQTVDCTKPQGNDITVI